MSFPEYNWHQPSPYIPGMMMTPRNPEMGQLMGLFAGQVLGPMFGPQNFVPHLTAGSMGIMDQYAMRHFQQQQLISANAIGTANNQDVATRLLALRTLGTNAPATEQNRNQAMTMANIINNPFMKGIVGSLVGPETLEAMMHGTKGDVSQLHNATMRMGFYMRDPSGARRMDAQSMEDFSRGVYAHLYEEGGDFEVLERQAAAAKDTDNRRSSRQKLKKAARIAENTDILTETDFVSRVSPDDIVMKEKIDRVYNEFVQGNEKDTIKQAAAIAKIEPAAQASGLLKENEMLLPHLRRAAEKMQVAEMHGLMAGQVGQLQEHMMQRGMLPQALGAMTAADRVKLMGEQLDDDTVKRIATRNAERYLFENSSEYRNTANDEEKRTMVAKELPRLEAEIRETSKTIQDFNAGKLNPKTSAEDIEKMGGFESIAGNVDSQRTASALKKYSGAVDAIREIFGDNGNPNAPMPALLAALDHLTQGANFQMDAKDVEATLRQMQMAAKEAGIGFEQMAGMSAQMGAMGQMLGLSPVAVMHGQANAMAMIKTMRESGTFSTPRFGAMGQGEAQQFIAQKMVAGDASDNAKAMAAGASIYMAGKESFAGSEFGAAMDAYLSGKDTYTFGEGPNKKTVNLFELVGRGGPAAIMQLFSAAGGRDQEFMSAFRSPLAMEFLQSGAGMQTMKYEALRDMNNLAVAPAVSSRIDLFAKNNAGTALAGQNAEKLGNIAGKTITNMLFESATMKTDDQIAFMSKEMPAQLKETFMQQLGLDEAAATSMAQEAVTAIIGDGPNAADTPEVQKKKLAEQRRRILELRNSADFLISARSNGQLNLVKASQAFGGDNDTKAMAEARRQRRNASYRAEAGIGFNENSHPFARVSDLLLDAGRTGEKVTTSRLFTELLNIVPNKKLAEQYVGGLRGGLDAANERLAELTYTDKYLRDLASKEKNDPELLALAAKAGIDVDASKLISDAEYNNAGKTAVTKLLTSGTDEEIRAAYAAASGESGTRRSREEMVRVLSGTGTAAINLRNTFAENEFFRDQAKDAEKLGQIAEFDDENKLRNTYARVFGTSAGDKTTKELKDELLASNWGVTTGKRVAETSKKMTRQQLAAKIGESQDVIGQLRDDVKNETASKFLGTATNDEIRSAFKAAGGDATVTDVTKMREVLRSNEPVAQKFREQQSQFETNEAKFLTNLNNSVFRAGEEKIRKQLVSDLTSTYGLADLTDDGVSVSEELDALIKDTKLDDPEAQKKIESFMRRSLTAGDKAADEATISRAQQASELIRKAATIDGSGAGITRDPKSDIGDINTRDATINASGGTIVIQGGNVKMQGGGAGATASGPGGQSEDGWFQKAWQWITGQPEPEQKTADQPPPAGTAAPSAGSSTPPTTQTGAAATGAVETATGSDPKQDKPLQPPVPAPNAKEIATAQDGRGEKRTVYDLTNQDLLQQIGADTETQQQELLQSAGLLDSLKDIKESRGDTVREITAYEIFATKMQDAVASGLIPAPVNEDGDPISDFESDEGVSAAEAHLKKYLPAIDPQAANSGTAAKQKAATEQAAQTYGTPSSTQPPQKKKYDYDPKEFTQSVTQKDGAYRSINGQFRDSTGKPIARPTNSPYFDAAHTVDVPKDDDRLRTGFVGKIGDKYYEEYKVFEGGPTNYREVTVGDNTADTVKQNPGEKAAAEQAAQTYARPLQVDLNSANPVTKINAYEQLTGGRITDRELEIFAGVSTADIKAAGRSTASKAAESAAVDAAAAATLPPSGMSSNNIVQTSAEMTRMADIAPIKFATSAAGGAAGTAATGGESGKPLEITGELSIVNLEKAVFAAQSKAGRINRTPGGPPVVRLS